MKIRRRAALIFVGFILILALPAGIFFVRSPALILSDASFDTLYGARRALIARIRLSLSLFRPVKKVLIAESADPDAAAFVLEEASKRPWGALLPARYERGGQRYAEAHPEVPVLIIEGRESRREGAGYNGENLRYVSADTMLDAYRAGRCAAILTREGSGADDMDGRNVIVFQDGQNFPFNRESFLAGVKVEGFVENPVFLDYNTNYSSYENSSVVLTGQAHSFLDRNIRAPVVLFSWLDPALTSVNVKLIFDDSPWALASRAFRTEKPPSSNIIIQEGRIRDPEVLRKIKRAIREEILQ